MNKEFLKMQKLAGLITESQVKQISENQNDFNTIENIISQTPYPVTDLESSYDLAPLPRASKNKFNASI